jgi:putative spermidine/putrescine transport system ATP-binding protein
MPHDNDSTTGNAVTNVSVKFESVSKNYGDFAALHPTSLEVREGEFFTLLGPSGSGKTTILNLIAGILVPSAGRIAIGERDVTKLPPAARELGMVFQNYALMPHMTVFDNVAYGLRVRHVGKDEIKRRVEEALELVQLPAMTKRYPKELSGGQQQRVALARSLVYNPKLILMDEPLSALDKKLRDQMQLQIKHLHSALGVTIVYVTHDQSEALMLSDRICLMNGGRIEQLGSPTDLYFEPRSEFAADFLGESNLFDAEVVDNGSGVSIRMHDGMIINGVAGAKPSPGTQVKVMIRPECLSPRPMPNSLHLEAKIAETLLLGGVTEVRTKLATGEIIAMRELTSRLFNLPEQGSTIKLYFDPKEVVVVGDPRKAA